MEQARAVFDRQPQSPRPIDRSHALGSRVLVAVTPTWSASGNGATPLTLPTTSIVTGPAGLAVNGGSGTYIRARATPATLPGRVAGATGDKRDFTMAFVVDGVQSGGWLCDQQGGGSYKTIADVYKDGSGNLIVNTSSGNLFSGQAFPSTAKIVIISMGTYLDSGTYIKPRVWFDGIGYDGTGTFGSPTQDSYATATIGEAAYFGSASFPTANYFLGKGYLAVIFRGNFTDAMAAEFTKNPWAIFEPQRIWVPVSAAPTFNPAWAANANIFIQPGVANA